MEPWKTWRPRLHSVACGKSREGPLRPPRRPRGFVQPSPSATQPPTLPIGVGRWRSCVHAVSNRNRERKFPGGGGGGAIGGFVGSPGGSRYRNLLIGGGGIGASRKRAFRMPNLLCIPAGAPEFFCTDLGKMIGCGSLDFDSAKNFATSTRPYC